MATAAADVLAWLAVLPGLARLAWLAGLAGRRRDDRPEHGDLAPGELEEIAGKERAERPGGLKPGGAERLFELGEHAGPPRHDLRACHDLRDGQRGHRGD